MRRADRGPPACGINSPMAERKGRRATGRTPPARDSAGQTHEGSTATWPRVHQATLAAILG